ncbi:hypothetical protein ACEPAG_6961 [Sanghuangporus baumii]
MLPVSVHSLPDELVKEILSETLSVPEDEFSYVGPSSPFGRKVSSSSDVLLVSKRWLRIGTPLLHECVVLRSSAQANSFYGFIKGKVGSQVKGYVRRMRLEGSFGAVVGKIFAILPGISDLYLRLPVTREENVNGLVQGLPKLNPTRVILELSPSKLRKNSLKMMAALNHEVRQWVTLHTFRIHFTFPWYLHRETGQLDRLHEALSIAPSLGQVIMSFSDMQYRFELYDAASFVEVIGRNTSLKAIHIHVDRPSSVNIVLDELLGKPCAGIVHCHLKSPQEDTPESERSSPDYPECIPTLPESVLGLIIEMDLKQCLGDDPLEVPVHRARIYKKRAFALFCVSKAFYVRYNICNEDRFTNNSSQRIAIPLVFRFLAIHPPQWSFPFLKKLLEDTSISPSVDTLVISKLGERFRIPQRGIIAEEKETTERIVMSLRTVQHLVLDTEFASYSDFMAEEFKLSVRGFHLRLTGNVFRQIFLTQFRNLTRLILRAEYNTAHGCPSVDTSDIIGRPCFDSLVNLKIINEHTHFDVINILQSCDFPSVTTLDFILDFGPAKSMDISHDRLPSFPKAQVVRFKGTPRGSYLQLLYAKHSPFEKLVLSSDIWDCTREDLLNGDGPITRILDKIDFSNMARLKELQLKTVEEWPWQDHELKKTAWQGRAQALIDTYGFKITDASGIPWRPRLMKRVNKKRRIS